jgi:hypothetical protein
VTAESMAAWTSAGVAAWIHPPRNRVRNAPDLGNGASDFTGGNQRFFDVNQDRNEKNQKTSRMKGAPNKVLKTKRKKMLHFSLPQ